jgi:hypothetical protein
LGHTVLLLFGIIALLSRRSVVYKNEIIYSSIYLNAARNLLVKAFVIPTRIIITAVAMMVKRVMMLFDIGNATRLRV